MNCFAAVAKWLLDINGILKSDKCSDDENSDTIIIILFFDRKQRM